MPNPVTVSYNDPTTMAPNTDEDRRIMAWNKANEMVCEVLDQNVSEFPPFSVRMRTQLNLARWLLGERPGSARSLDDATD